MSSEAAMAEIIERAFEALGLGDDQPSDDLAECIQAVRAQWAAEVERLQEKVREDSRAIFLAQEERDSAQARVEVLEKALIEIRDQTIDWSDAEAIIRTALQPGDQP